MSNKLSSGEKKFLLFWKAIGGLAPELEYKFHDTRRWRFDFAWPLAMVAVEIEGGVWMKRGGHTTGVGYTNNCEKYNEAAFMDWVVIRLTPQMISNLVCERIFKLIIERLA